MAMYFHAIVTCRERGAATVQLTSQEREALGAGRLPCPSCGNACAPAIALVHDHGSFANVLWNGARWGQAAPSES